MRRTHPYPWREVAAGLAAAGYQAEFELMPRDSALVLTWNNYGRWGDWARTHRERGRPHVVIENGYGIAGCYLLERDGHNGLGWIPCPPDDSRTAMLAQRGVRVEPWRGRGEHILVCAQRGRGYSGQAMRDTWPDEVIGMLRCYTDRPIWYRPHPGNPRLLPRPDWPSVQVVSCYEPLERQLQRCHAVVVWTSSVALLAVLAGVPAFFCGPAVLGQHLMGRDLRYIEHPPMPEGREEMLWALSWRVWTREELATARPYTFVLQQPSAVVVGGAA